MVCNELGGMCGKVEGPNGGHEEVGKWSELSYGLVSSMSWASS